METVNIHEAKTHLSRLIARAAKGETFIIAKAGKPLVKMVPISPGAEGIFKKSRLGFLKGQFKIPDDFDRIDAAEIAALFSGTGKE